MRRAQCTASPRRLNAAQLEKRGCVCFDHRWMGSARGSLRQGASLCSSAELHGACSPGAGNVAGGRIPSRPLVPQRGAGSWRLAFAGANGRAAAPRSRTDSEYAPQLSGSGFATRISLTA